MKGQAAITEYFVLIFLIAMIAVIAVIMVFGFQMLGTGAEKANARERNALFIAEGILSSGALNSPQFPKGSVLDDSRLTAASCADLWSLLGEGWHAEVRVLRDRSACDGVQAWLKTKCLADLRKAEGAVCTDQSYPSCSVWRFCEKKEDMIYFSVPVSVYRKMNGTMDLGVLTVGLE